MHYYAFQHNIPLFNFIYGLMRLHRKKPSSQQEAGNTFAATYAIFKIQCRNPHLIERLHHPPFSSIKQQYCIKWQIHFICYMRHRKSILNNSIPRNIVSFNLYLYSFERFRRQKVHIGVKYCFSRK